MKGLLVVTTSTGYREMPGARILFADADADVSGTGVLVVYQRHRQETFPAATWVDAIKRDPRQHIEYALTNTRRKDAL